MFVIRSKVSGKYLTRFPEITFTPERFPGYAVVWWNDLDLQSFAWVASPIEARKCEKPSDILGLFSGLTIDPKEVEVCRFKPSGIEPVQTAFGAMEYHGEFTVTPLGTIAELMETGLKSLSKDGTYL